MKQKVLVFLILIAVLAPAVVLAANDAALAQKNLANQTASRFLKCGFDTDGDGMVAGAEECGFTDVVLVIKNIINYLIVLGLAVSVISFSYAGYLMMTSGGAAENINHAKSIFTKVVIGFIIMIAAWLIVKTIEITFLSPEFQQASYLK